MSVSNELPEKSFNVYRLDVGRNVLPLLACQKEWSFGRWFIKNVLLSPLSGQLLNGLKNVPEKIAGRVQLGSWPVLITDSKVVSLGGGGKHHHHPHHHHHHY